MKIDRFTRVSGFSLVEMLVGTVLVTTASLSLVGIVVHMANQASKAQTQSRALALQSEVLAALTRDDTFASAAQLHDIQNVTRSSSGGSGNALVEGLSLVTPTGKTIAVSGARTGLDMNFNPCDPNSKDCPFLVDLALRCSASFGCEAAYRVSVAQAASALSSASLGAPLRGVGSISDAGKGTSGGP